MITLLRWEIHRLYRRFAPYLLYGASTLLIGLMTWGMAQDRRAFRPRAGGAVEIIGDLRNGLFECQAVSVTIAMLLLYLAPVVIGEILGGEGAAGTLRTMLVRPRARWQVWLAKYLTAWVYAISVAAFTLGLSLAIGTLCFGWGKLTSVSPAAEGKVIVMTAGEGLRFILLSYSLMTLSMMTGGTVAVALGSWFDNALAPGFTAVALVITLQIICGMNFEWVEKVKPYLFSNYLFDHAKAYPTAFDPDTGRLLFPGAQVWPMVRVHCVTIILFATAGLWRFVRRDVTC